MPVVLRYSLVMTVADCVSLAIQLQLRGGAAWAGRPAHHRRFYRELFGLQWLGLPFVILFVALVIVAVLTGALMVWYQRRKSAGYRQYCRAKGFGYAASPTPRKLRRLRDYTKAEQEPAAEALKSLPVDLSAVFEALGGSSFEWTHTITGQWGGHPFIAFHYAVDYAMPQGPRISRPRGVMLWEVPGRTFPQFVLMPEGFWHRLAEKFGAQDIDVDGDPDFSQAYRLRGDEESGVRTLFTPALRRFLTAHPGQRVAGAGRCLAWWVEGGLPKPERLDAFLERGDAVRRAFLA